MAAGVGVNMPESTILQHEDRGVRILELNDPALCLEEETYWHTVEASPLLVAVLDSWHLDKSPHMPCVRITPPCFTHFDMRHSFTPGARIGLLGDGARSLLASIAPATTPMATRMTSL